MKSASLAFALLSTAVLSTTALIGAAPVSAPMNQMTKSASRPKLWTNPTPHVYQSGERVSSAYGPFTEIADWKDRGLLPPAEGHRWVHYGDTYLLIESDNQLITTITRASLPEGRA
jgi:Ni/Co efflux regulator RcnB